MWTKKYEIEATCDNCSKESIIKIPKGIRIKEFLESDKGKCDNCGVPIEYSEVVNE